MLCSLIILMSFFFIRIRRPPRSTRTDTLFPDTTLFRSSASDGQQVDPRSMERAARVPDAGPIDARIVGAWEVWIPGSVYYTTDGLRIAQHYQPGAAMTRLEIASDGRYRSGDRHDIGRASRRASACQNV